MTQIYDFKMKLINGEEQSLSDYQGKVLLMVNVASKCGLTPQYSGLEKVYQEYKAQGLEILAFPANEFLAQEPGTNEEIAQFCEMNYKISFPLFQKIVVKGEGQHPLYQYLTTMAPHTQMKPDGTLMERLSSKGLITGKENDLKWNFEKFLIGKKGEILGRFSPEIPADDSIILDAISKALNS